MNPDNRQMHGDMCGDMYEEKEIRRIWSKEESAWYYSLVDVAGAVTGTTNPRRYWSDLKRKNAERLESLVKTGIVQLKFPSKDGKSYATDAAKAETVRAVLELFPSGQTEQFEKWLLRKEKQRNTAKDRRQEGSDAVRQAETAPMPFLCTPFTPGMALKCIRQMEDGDAKKIALAEYYYFSGQPKRALRIVERYLDNAEICLRLSACWIFAYANLSIDRIHSARYGIIRIKEEAEKGLNGESSGTDKAVCAFMANAVTVLLHLPSEHLPSMKDTLKDLSEGLKLYACYIMAHEAYLHGEYGRSAGIVETSLACCVDIYPVPMIYLHLAAAMSYMGMKQMEEARGHFMSAWELAAPDNLIEGIGEHHGLLGGLVEVCLKKEYPERFKKIIEITYQFSAGWRRIHNLDTGEKVADDLTTTEFSIAMLAGRSWTNREIAGYMGLSENTVKKYLSDIYSKLSITKREELKAYMLR